MRPKKPTERNCERTSKDESGRRSAVAGGVKVVGLNAFARRVNRAAKTEPRLMKSGLNEVGEIIVHDAVPLMESQFVTDPDRRDGKLADSMRAQSTTREGRVVLGYPARVPYAGWWEFGGSTKRKAGGMDRKWVKRGRSLYPTLDKDRERITAAMDAVLRRIAEIINV